MNKAMPSLFISKMQSTIVNRGDWLGKPAKIKVENNGAVGYVGKLPDRAQSFVYFK